MARHRDPKMLATRTGSGNNYRTERVATRFQRLPHIFENVRLRYDADNMARRRKLKISLVADNLSSECRPMPAHVGSVIPESGIAENVRAVDRGTLPAPSVQKLFSLPVCMAAIFSSGCPPISDHVGSIMTESGVGEMWGYPLKFHL